MPRANSNTFTTLDEVLQLSPPPSTGPAYYEAKHTTEPGFYARIYKADKHGRVTRAWATRYHELAADGSRKEKRPTIGLVAAQDGEKPLDILEAQLNVRTLLKEVNEAKKSGRAIVPTLKDAFEAFIRHKTVGVASDNRLRPATVIDYENRFRQLVPATMLAKRLNELAWTEWSLWKTAVTTKTRPNSDNPTKPFMPVSELRALGLLKGVVSGVYKYWSGRIPGLVTPLKELRNQGVVSNVRRVRKDYIQTKDLPLAMTTIKTQLSQDARDCVLIALFTGWRASLVLKVRLDRINEEARTVRWLTTDEGGPYHEEFDYPISDWLWNEVFVPRLLLATPKQVYLIPTNSKRSSKSGHYTDIRVQTAKLQKALGYRAGLQDLRRTYATVGSAAGVHAYQLAHLMMHETAKDESAQGVSKMGLDYTKKDPLLMMQSTNEVAAKMLQLAGIIKAPEVAPSVVPAFDITKLSAVDRDALIALLQKAGAT